MAIIQKVSGSIRLLMELYKWNEQVLDPYSIPFRIDETLIFGYKGTSGYDAGIDDIDEVWQDVIPLAASPAALDLRGLINQSSVSAAFTIVRGGVLVNLSQNPGEVLTITPAAIDGWSSGPTDAYRLGPSTENNISFWAFGSPNSNGYPTGASDKVWQLDPGSDTFDVALIFYGVKV